MNLISIIWNIFIKCFLDYFLWFIAVLEFSVIKFMFFYFCCTVLWIILFLGTRHMFFITMSSWVYMQPWFSTNKTKCFATSTRWYAMHIITTHCPFYWSFAMRATRCILLYPYIISIIFSLWISHKIFSHFTRNRLMFFFFTSKTIALSA